MPAMQTRSMKRAAAHKSQISELTSDTKLSMGGRSTLVNETDGKAWVMGAFLLFLRLCFEFANAKLRQKNLNFQFCQILIFFIERNLN